MGLFGKIFQVDSKKEVTSPTTGKVVKLSDVKDETFAQGILGDGIAVLPSKGGFVAPIDGVLESFFPTGHAFSITGDNGVELLVHIGFDTVELKGKYFTPHATQGQKVKQGDLLVEADLEKIVEAGYDITTPVIVLNGDSFKGIEKTQKTEIGTGEVLLSML